MPAQEAAEREGTSLVTTRNGLIKFSPERLKQIKNLVERGKSRDEIADILQVTIGSLQITCSKMGISLRRPKISSGVCLLKKREPRCNNSTVTPHSSDQDGQLPSQLTQEQAPADSQPGSGEPAAIVKQQHDPTTTPDAYPASFAIRFQYRGMERTAELPLTPHTIGQLALEAALRNLTISELIAELIKATVSKDLFPLALDNVDSEWIKSRTEELG